MLKQLLLLIVILGVAPALTSLSLHADEVAAVSQLQTININTADAETLANMLDGVGYNRALAIIQYRSSNGPFFTVDDLLEVRGVGPSIVDKNRDRITLE